MSAKDRTLIKPAVMTETHSPEISRKIVNGFVHTPLSDDVISRFREGDYDAFESIFVFLFLNLNVY